jgi:hypothetical protein
VGKCKKVLNVMRCLTVMEWGAGRASLKNIYVVLIRSVIVYGSIAYGLARCHTGTRTGAFQTSPVATLQVVMGEMPLQIRRQQLAINYLGQPTGTWGISSCKRDFTGMLGT